MPLHKLAQPECLRCALTLELADPSTASDMLISLVGFQVAIRFSLGDPLKASQAPQPAGRLRRLLGALGGATPGDKLRVAPKSGKPRHARTLRQPISGGGNLKACEPAGQRSPLPAPGTDGSGSQLPRRKTEPGEPTRLSRRKAPTPHLGSPGPTPCCDTWPQPQSSGHGPEECVGREKPNSGQGLHKTGQRETGELLWWCKK